MTLRHIRHQVEAPITTAHDNRLHNCGYGRPPEQYLTPALGTGFDIDLHSLLLSWRDVSPAVALELNALRTLRRRYPRALLASCAWALLVALHGTASGRDDDPEAALAALSAHVMSLGLTRGVLLTCAVTSRGTAQPVQRGGMTTEPVALALVAMAASRPPMVMWGVEPSLENIAPGAIMRMRWLRRGEAGSEARAVWDALAGARPAGGDDASR